MNLGPQFTHENRALMTEPCYPTSFHTVVLWVQPSPCSICVEITSKCLAGIGLGLKSRLAPGGVPWGSCDGRAGREGTGGDRKSPGVPVPVGSRGRPREASRGGDPFHSAALQRWLRPSGKAFHWPRQTSCRLYQT